CAVSGRGVAAGRGGGAACGRERAPTGGADVGGREGFGCDGASVVERVGRESGTTAGRAPGGGQLSTRFTIERMRTLVLAAGVLLLVALAVFLAVGKLKDPFNTKELPKR